MSLCLLRSAHEKERASQNERIPWAMASKVEKRRIEILHVIETEGSAEVGEMAAFFKVTPETIRKDFEHLSAAFKLERTHGGLKKDAENRLSDQYHYHQRQGVQQEAKRELCYKVVQLLEPGDCVYVDTGSTLTWLLPFMNLTSEVTLVSPSIAFLTKYIMEGYAAVFQNRRHHFVFLGGEVNSELLTTCGGFMTQSLADFHFSKVLFSVDAVDQSHGCMNTDLKAYQIGKSAIAQGQKIILVADSSKFGLTATYKVAGWNEIDLIVTDKAPDETWQGICQKHRVTWLC
ncbi:MAG: DeoR/GlpR transcriptional regulator [Clostridia bacterium]|nr:DeoR/GlpR transcriptional regulator [Clostridia bacterium]